MACVIVGNMCKEHVYCVDGRDGKVTCAFEALSNILREERNIMMFPAIIITMLPEVQCYVTV